MARLGTRLRRLRSLGWNAVIDGALRRIAPARPSFLDQATEIVRGKSGLEVGGPSAVFRHRDMLPIYDVVGGLDNINYASSTFWEHDLTEGGAYVFDPRRPAGRQRLREATSLTGVADAAYDFLASSHCLEHTANPLAALLEWRRVTRPGGHMLLVLPDVAMTFDHKRPVTTIEHIREDFAKGTPESDTTHFAETLALHDVDLNPHIEGIEALRQLVEDNVHTRYVHHHVFDLALMKAVLEETGWRVIAAEAVRPIHLVALAVNDRADT